MTKGSVKQRLVVRGLFLGHCFVTSEAPFRFPEVILVPFEPQKNDLQVGMVSERQVSKEVDFLIVFIHFRFTCFDIVFR